MYRILILIFLLLACGCNKQSESLKYNEPILAEIVDGYSRDLIIHNDTLFVVNKDEGLLIYKIDIGTIITIDTTSMDSIFTTSLILNTIYSNPNTYKNWNLSGVLYSNKMDMVFLLDEFYETYSSKLADILIGLPNYQNIKSKTDNQHSSKFTINNSNDNLDIFILIRNKSGYSTSGITSIYQSKWSKEIEEFVESLVIDSLYYNLMDVHYLNQKLIISNTNDSFPEFQIYNISETVNPFYDTLTIINTIETPAIPNALYSTGDTLFVGMGDHGGVQVYKLSNADNIELISWFATGFSVKEIYWEPSFRRVLLSCSFQGVVVIELDENMQEVDSWILNTSYAYAARNYMGHIIVATRNGLEIINLNNSQ